MNLDAPLMNDEPPSVTQAWGWIESILAEQPHGKSFWQIEQDKERVRALCWWIRERRVDDALRIARNEEE